MSAQVTAMGIRDGDPAVLQALVNRRGAAVLAYCERACAPSLAPDAAADAFVRFRAQVLATERPGDINPEVALLSATRHAAASRAPRPPATGGATGGGRLPGGEAAAAADRLPDVPDLLADRADGVIAREDEQVLEALLASSPVARSIQERFVAAEAAYRSAPREPPPEPITEQIVATMGALAAVPTNGGPRAAAVEPTTAPGPPQPLPAAPRFFPTEPPQPAAEVPEPEPSIEEPEPVPEPEPAFEEPEPEPEPVEDEPATPDAPAPDPFAAEGVSDPFAVELEDRSTEPDPEPDLAEDEEEVAPTEDGATAERQADEAVDVDAAVPDSAEIAAARGEDVEPDGTVEWTVPENELGESPEHEHEIAAARLPDAGRDEDPAHLQSASGAVAEDDVTASVPPAPAPMPDAPHHHRHGLPGRTALAPAAAVVAVAAIGAMAASGVFGGNDPSPAVDTGIVPERALQAVPEGEANAVIDDLRAASADARRRRLADQRRQAATGQPAPEETTTAAADDDEGADAQEPSTTGGTSEPEAIGGDGDAGSP